MDEPHLCSIRHIPDLCSAHVSWCQRSCDLSGVSFDLHLLASGTGCFFFCFFFFLSRGSKRLHSSAPHVNGAGAESRPACEELIQVAHSRHSCTFVWLTSTSELLVFIVPEKKEKANDNGNSSLTVLSSASTIPGSVLILPSLLSECVRLTRAPAQELITSR